MFIIVAQYYFYTHSYINYANIAWSSTYMSTWKKKYCQLKYVLYYYQQQRKHEHMQELFRSKKVSNVYQLNILNNVISMLRYMPYYAQNIKPKRALHQMYFYWISKNSVILISLHSISSFILSRPTNLVQYLQIL